VDSAAFVRVREVVGTRFETGFVMVLVVDVKSISGMRSSRNMTVVADVQVVADDTAVFTESTLELIDVIG
jgi:hypothetical protein